VRSSIIAKEVTASFQTQTVRAGTVVPIVEVMGCKISSITLFEALATIEMWIEQQSPRCKFVVATGFHGIWEAQKSLRFRDVLNSADLFCPDGIAPVWLSHILGQPLNGRVPGPDLLSAFVNVANIKGYSSFFLGDTPETLAALTGRIKGRYPGHHIAGSLSPPFRQLTEDDNADILNMIRLARPDVLWVAFGLPKQELWISEHLMRLQVPVAIAVGAAFGFVSGQIKRAPLWMRSAGLEWLWRLAHETTQALAPRFRRRSQVSRPRNARMRGRPPPKWHPPTGSRLSAFDLQAHRFMR
jgi:N-acetylglucosaminyldiphosphoundecaprenol N-acetyl-beta-D-mannosaminyltransferase